MNLTTLEKITGTGSLISGGIDFVGGLINANHLRIIGTTGMACCLTCLAISYFGNRMEYAKQTDLDCDKLSYFVANTNDVKNSIKKIVVKWKQKRYSTQL